MAVYRIYGPPLSGDIKFSSSPSKIVNELTTNLFLDITNLSYPQLENLAIGINIIVHSNFVFII